MMLLPVAQLRLQWFLQMLPPCATLHIWASNHPHSDRGLRLSLMAGLLQCGTGTLEHRSMTGPEAVQAGWTPSHQVLMGLGGRVGTTRLLAFLVLPHSLQLRRTIMVPEGRQPITSREGISNRDSLMALMLPVMRAAMLPATCRGARHQQLRQWKGWLPGEVTSPLGPGPLDSWPATCPTERCLRCIWPWTSPQRSPGEPCEELLCTLRGDPSSQGQRSPAALERCLARTSFHLGHHCGTAMCSRERRRRS